MPDEGLAAQRVTVGKVPENHLKQRIGLCRAAHLEQRIGLCHAFGVMSPATTETQ